MNIRLRKFISYYRPYRGLLFAVLGCSMLVALTELAFPLLVRVITKDILEVGLPDAMARILRVGGVMLLLLLINTGVSYFYDYHGHAMGAMMERDMRGELFAHYQSLPFSFHDDQKPGQLMSRLTNDIHNLAELYHHGPEDLIINGLKFIGALVILYLTDATLTLVAACFLPVIGVFTVVMGKRMNAAIRKSLERIAEVNALAEENLSGIRVVKSFANEPLEIEKFGRENDQYLHSRKSIYRNESIVYTGIMLLTKLITAAVVVFGGIAITRQTLDLADLITFMLYISYITEPITRLAFMIQQFQEGIAGFNRFADAMEVRPAPEEVAGTATMAGVRGDISFRDVGFRYRPNHPDVLAGVSIDIHAGETVAIVGQSGVGKTTLCALIPRFYEPTQGKILLDGMNIRDVSLESLRRNIGVVQQDVYLFSGTVAENIRYGRQDAADGDIIKAAKRANAHEFIMALPDGYDTEIGHRGIKLSGGQKQRLSIARVFLKDPPVLILDEATSSLDNESEKVVQESLDALARDRTTLVIAHRLTTIQDADRILVLSGEGIAEQGTHAELLARKGVYAQLYGAGTV